MTKLGLALLLIAVLFGNGLRSVISSAVFMSEGEFASFLNISVTQTSAILELLLGAVLLSLLVSPYLMQRFSARWLAAAMCLLAGCVSLGLAALFYVSPGVATREAVVIVLFPLLGFALASLAPIAQLMTGWGGENHAKLMTGAWAVAMPAAFLVTPQLVRIVAPRFGLDLFFALFALAPLLLIVGIVRASRRAPAQEVSGGSKLSARGLWPSVLLLFMFEAMTLCITMVGITSAWVWGFGVGFLAALMYLLMSLRGDDGQNSTGAYIYWIFAAIFLSNIATTGFYDTAYLVQHLCTNTLLADRATLGALAQVIAAMTTTAVLSRYPAQTSLMVVGCAIMTAGLWSYMLYFSFPYFAVFVSTKAVTSFGTGMLTTAAIFAIMKAAGKNARLSLFIAFVIIIGTEFGLEAFEALIQSLDLFDVATETSFALVFVIQIVVGLATLVPLAKSARRSAGAAMPDAGLSGAT